MAQLKMCWFASTPYDEVVLPEGYSISNYRGDADKPAWVEICKNGLIGDDATVAAFDDAILSRGDIVPERDVFFLDCNGEHIGTVTAYVDRGRNVGDMHMVSIRTDFRGRGLARILNWITFDHLHDSGVPFVHLTTDEWRKGAVKTYLSGGFLPVEYDVGMEARWAAVLEDLGIDSVQMVNDDGSSFKVIFRTGLRSVDGPGFSLSPSAHGDEDHSQVTSGRLQIVCNNWGGITNLSVAGDATAMNWVHAADNRQYRWIGAEYAWGSGSAKVGGMAVGWKKPVWTGVDAEGSVLCDYRPCPQLKVRVVRWMERAGKVLHERYLFENVASTEVRLDEVDVHTPFNDNYPGQSRELFTRRCHAHVWPGGAGGWVAAMRMGGAAPHLGLVVVEGDVSAFELKERALEKAYSNTRGIIALSPQGRTLKAGETFAVGWRVFAHTGWEDFFRQVVELGGIEVQASKYVARVGEEVTITTRTAAGARTTTWRCPALGEFRIPVACADGRQGWVELLGVDDPEALILARARFIVAHQQVNEPGSAYDGALVLYDNEEERQVRRWEARDAQWQLDQSEGAERVGMGVFLALLAQRGHKDEFLPALERYYRFVRTGLQDPDYTSWGSVRHPDRVRAFNYPWIVWFYLEMYNLTGRMVYLDDMFGTLRRLFKGDINVPDSLVALPLRDSVLALRNAGRMEQARELQGWYARLAEPLTAADDEIRTQEVGMAPEMVSSCLKHVLGLYTLTNDEKYLRASKRIIRWAEAVCGRQPSWHSHDIGLHHWDGYWFGKRKCWGDTLPHDWNGEMAEAFEMYAQATGDTSYQARVAGIADAMLGLFTPDGRGTCAWVYPNRVNGRPARFADPFANDQDWALVFHLLMH